MDKAQESIVVAALTRFLSHCQVHFTAYVDNDSSCVSSAGRPFTQNIMGGARGGGGGGGGGGGQGVWTTPEKSHLAILDQNP